MNRHMFSTSVAALALIAALGGAVVAQTATTGAAPEAAQAQATDSGLPPALAALNLTDLRSETKRDGMREISGRTADGVEIEAKIDMAGNLVEVEADDGVLPQPLIDAVLSDAARGHEAMALFASIDEIKLRPEHLEVKGRQANGEDAEVKFDREDRLVEVELDGAALPDTLVQSLLPQAVRDAEVLGQFARLDEIRTHRGSFDIKGQDASGRDMGASFDEEGRVLRFGNDGGPKRHKHDRDDGPRHDRKGDRDGPRGDWRHGHHGGPRDGGPAGGPGMMPPPAFDAVAVNQRLADAGYTGFGFLRPEGPRVVLEATNPQGEPVLLELDPQGEVLREMAR